MKRALLFFLLLPSLAWSHLDAGVDRQAGQYFFELGWTPSTPVAGQQTAFALNIRDAKTLEATNVSSVWLRIAGKDAVAFAGTLALSGGSSAFSFVFPQEGEWVVDAAFGGYQEKVAIKVAREPLRAESLAIFLVALIVSAAALFKRTE